MEILLATLISLAIVREDVHLDVANSGDKTEMTKSSTSDSTAETK